MKFRSLVSGFTFRTRLFLCFSFFAFLFFVWAACYFFIAQQQRHLRAYSLRLNGVQNNYLKSVDALDRFMISGFHDPAFYKTGRQTNIDQFLSIQKSISGTLPRLRREAKSIHLEVDRNLDTLVGVNRNLSQLAIQLRGLYFKRGFVDYGTEGIMRGYAHWIELHGKISPVAILQLRRHEKDFIMRGKDLYANEFIGTIDSLIRLSPPSGDTFLELEHYKSAFQLLVSLSNSLGTYSNTGVVPLTQHQIDRFDRVFNRVNQISSKTIVSFQDRLNGLLILITVSFLIIAFILSNFLSGYLTADIKELDRQMDAFRNSDFRNGAAGTLQPAVRPRSIELRRLFEDFERLKKTLIDYINNLTRQTEDLQCLNEELLAQSEELRLLNEELLAQKEREDKANERYHFVTKATSDAIWDWDLTSDQLTWAEGFHTIFGHEITEIQPASARLNEFLHPEDARRVGAGIQSVIASAQTNWKDEYRYLKADGTYAYVVDRGFLIRDRSGKPVRMVGAMHDISKRKQEEQHLKLLRSVITNANDAVMITEPAAEQGGEPVIKYVNEAFSRMTGYPDNEVLGRSPRLLQGPKSDKYAILRLSSAVKNWQRCEISTINYKKSGEEFWVDVSISPVTDENGTYTHMIAIIRDITAKKNIELELQLSAGDLFSRNKELHQFGYVVSHNLRSPIANIMGISNLLELDSEDPVTVQQCTKKLKTAIYSLDGVVRDLSKILTISDGSVELTKETVDLTLILNDIRNDLKDALRHSNGTIEIPEISFFIFSHRAYLYSIFYNLISNAIKYKSQQHPHIRIHIDAIAGHLRIRIADNGIGIDLDKHGEELFKPYKRFTLEAEGKGLGLFLVKSHVESLKGTIAVESHPGRGTTFTIALPCQSNRPYLSN